MGQKKRVKKKNSARPDRVKKKSQNSKGFAHGSRTEADTFERSVVHCRLRRSFHSSVLAIRLPNIGVRPTGAIEFIVFAQRPYVCVLLRTPPVHP